MTWRGTATIKLGQESGVTKRNLDIPVSPTLHTVLGKLADKGHKSLIVGGAVRDAMMGTEPKDIDVEVYGTNYEDLASTLSQHGKVNQVGKAFGVIKFKDKEKNEYDFSLPRRENKTGVGHRDFATEFDPTITPPEAAARRDFTFNAMAYDPLHGELHDYFGGEKDLNDRVIRHTSEAFSEDPLRVLRGMQFAARYGMKVHPDTAKLSESISHEYSTIPKERVSEEFMKLATKGKEPGRAIDYLKDTGWHKNFPELHDMYGTKQEPKWHPEGDLEVHTKHAMNAAAKIADREGLKGDDRAVAVFGAMAHDMGKPSNTTTNDAGEIISHGHDTAGGPVARNFLNGIGIKKDITDKVVPLVENHMQHLNYENGISSRTVRRLAERLQPASIKELSYVMESDHSGRPPLPSGLPSGAQKMLDAADRSHVTDKPMERFVNGRDVLPYFPGVEPGPHIGEHVKAAYEAQLNGEINSPEEGQAWLKKRLGKTASQEDFEPETDVMYHFHHPGLEEHIKQHGIEAADPNGLMAGTDRESFPGSPKAVYMYHPDSLPGTLRGAGDLYEIDTKGLDVTPDFNIDGAWYHEGTIPPERVKKVGWKNVAIAPRRPYYHVAPADARDSIEQHGIDHLRGDSPWKHMEDEEDPDYDDWSNEDFKGNYLYSDEEMAKGYAGAMSHEDGPDQDVWKVDTLGRGDLEGDPEDTVLNPHWDPELPVNGQRWMTKNPIEPDRVKRVAMPRDEGFLQNLNFEHIEGPHAHSLLAWAPGADHPFGRIDWDNETADSPPTISGIDVYHSYQRHGLGSELLRRARDIEPKLHHDSTLTEDGAALVKNFGDQVAGPVTAGHDGDLPDLEYRVHKGPFTPDINADNEMRMKEDLGHSGKGMQGGISAHLPDGTMVAGIGWGHDRVKQVQVHPDWTRRGIATELFQQAKQLRPRLRHSDDLTDLGQQWKKSLSEKTAAWKDVRNKAVRLRNANMVNIILQDDNVIAADVQGDHATYHVVLYRQYPESMAITLWECSCKWGDWAFKRQVTYVGRMCSHALATLYAAHGEEFKKQRASHTKMGALKPHDHHDIDDDDILKKHMLKKHVHKDDEELQHAIHGLHGDDLQQFHGEDHDFFGEFGWDDNQEIPDFDDKDYAHPLEKSFKPYKKLRADEYVKDVEPSEKREGDDFDYDTRWFNKGLNHHVLDTVKHLTDSYPVTKDWFKGIRVSDAGPMPCVVPGDKRIWLPPSYVDKPGSPARAPQKSLDHLIAHEFGHALHASIQAKECGPESVPDASMDELKQSLQDQDIRDEHNVKMHHPDSPATWAMDSAKKKFPGQSASSYAEKDDLERFAESMADHWTSPHPAEQSSHIGNMIDFLYHKDSPAWKERGDSKTASADLQDMLEDHNTRQSMKKKSNVDRDLWTHKGKPFSFGVVSLLDGEIEETHSYKKAEDHDFHHSFYIGEEHLEPIENNEKDVFWLEDGEPRAMKGLPPGMRESIRSQIEPASKTSSTHTGLRRSKLTFYAATGRPVVINVEVADDPGSIQQGLMNRMMMPMMDGMVFIPQYKPSYTGFWMKNTFIPLSIAFWDRAGIITEIIDMAPGDTTIHKPKMPWWGAVEVNRGFFRQWSIMVGCRVVLNL